MKVKYFHLAKKISLLSNHHQHKMGCVLVKKNRVISLAPNKIQTHPKSKHSYNMLHAEIGAILKADRTDLEGSTAYIYRERKDGTQGMAKPCISCYKMLKEAGVHKVAYSITDKPYFTEEYL